MTAVYRAAGTGLSLKVSEGTLRVLPGRIASHSGCECVRGSCQHIVHCAGFTGAAAHRHRGLWVGSHRGDPWVPVPAESPYVRWRVLHIWISFQAFQIKMPRSFEASGQVILTGVDFKHMALLPGVDLDEIFSFP